MTQLHFTQEQLDAARAEIREQLKLDEKQEKQENLADAIRRLPVRGLPKAPHTDKSWRVR